MQLTDWSNLDLIFGVVKHQGWCSYPFINGLQARSEPVSLLAGIKRPRNTSVTVISDNSHEFTSLWHFYRTFTPITFAEMGENTRFVNRNDINDKNK